MITKLETFLERLDTANTTDDLSGLAGILRDTYDVKHMSYLVANLNGMLVDPVVRGALQRFNPLDWKRLD
ncbi:MAG: hypothetical protein ABGW81_09965 [Paracoccaceae bacterium]